MQIVSRVPFEYNDPVDLDFFLDYLRVDGSEAHVALYFADAAKVELERYCQIALFHEEVTVLTGKFPGRFIELPIGPGRDDEFVLVKQVETNGDTTAIMDGWRFSGGRYPSVTFDDEPAGPLLISYTAGFAEDVYGVPRDLKLAICDLALRLYDQRGDTTNTPATFPPAAARIAARYRRVRLDA